MRLVSLIGRVFTDNLPKSVGIGLLAMVVSFMPFLWALLNKFFESAGASQSSTELMVYCIDEWLLGSVAAGVAGSVNWMESKIDFDLDFMSDLLGMVAGIGALIALVVFHATADNHEVLMKHSSQYQEFIFWTYYLGIGLSTVSFSSIFQCRRAKDLNIVVRV